VCTAEAKPPTKHAFGEPVVSDNGSSCKLAQKVEREQLRLGIEQHRRVAVPHFAASLVVAALAWKIGVAPIALVLWLLLTGALQLTRYVYVDRLQKRFPSLRAGEVSTAQNRLACWIRILGAVNAFMVVAMFSKPVSQEHFLATMVWLGNAAGTVSVVSGRTLLYVQWAVMYGGTLAVVWLLQGTWETASMAALAVLLFVMLSLHVRDQGRMLLELVSLTDSLQRERDRVESVSASKTRFFAAASHDLRQPLTALAYHAATIQAVAQRDDDPLLRQVGDGISRALNESTGLLDSLLEISRLDAGAVPVHLEVTEVSVLLSRVCEEFAPLARSRGLSLTATMPPALATRPVRTDVALLRRILQNLVGNAIKFTESGRIELALGERRQGESHALSIAVSDTGRGIPGDAQEKIFEEFFQLGNAERDRTRGLGLGLAIVNRMVQLIHAKIEVQSEPGRGSTFTVLLPVADETDASPHDGVVMQAAIAAEASGSCRVLCLDDEQEVRSSLTTLLTTLGFEVRTASDAGEAVSALADGFMPDVLLVDFRLRNGLSGLEAVETLRAAQCKAPVLLITGDTAPARIAEAQAVGVDVLYKPVDGRRLIERIRELSRRDEGVEADA
jgi:signal transduction histidine kinase/CheY-like chemotaxis protein